MTAACGALQAFMERTVKATATAVGTSTYAVSMPYGAALFASDHLSAVRSAALTMFRCIITLSIICCFPD